MKTSMNVFPYENALLNAMALHCTDLVTLLLEQDSNAITNMNEALALAIEIGNEAIVDALIHHAALHKKAVLGGSSTGEALNSQTPGAAVPVPLLHTAAASGHCGIFSRLLAAGSDKDAKDDHGRTALHFASQFGHIGVLQQLRNQGAMIDSQDSEGSTPLHLACKWQQRDAVVDLILYEAFQSPTITILPDKTKSTPLHLAVTGGHYNVVKRLIDPIKASPMRQDFQLRGDFESSIEKCDAEGMLPIHLAVLSEDASIVQEICNEHIRRNRPIDTFDEHSKNALHVAASSGSVDIVRTLLGTGAAPDITDANYQTPLLLACGKGFDDIVKLLLRAGANPMHTDDRNRSALHEAVAGGTPNTIETLLEVSQLLATEDELLSMRDNDGNTPFHVAAQRGEVAIMKALLNNGKHLRFLGIRDIWGQNPLYLASTAGNLKMVEFIIEQVKENTLGGISDDSAGFPLIKALLEVIPPLNDDDSSAESSLFSDILKVLSTVQNVDRWSESEHKTILFLAVEKGMKETVESIIDVSKAHQYDETIEEALALAAETGRADIVKWLVQSDENKEKHYRRLAITTAAKYGKLGVLESLVTPEGPKLANETFKDALVKAAEYGHTTSIRFLLNNGDALTPAGELSEALEKAIDSESDEIVALLLDSGAGLPDSWTSESAPLHRAVERGDQKLCRLLLQARHSFLNETNSDGRTALFVASWHGQLSLVDILLREFKADPEIEDDMGWRALHAAYDNSSITRYLIDANVEINAKEAMGKTALHIALERGYNNTAEELLNGGAKPLAADASGSTPIHIAASEGVNLDLFRRLLKDTQRAGDLRNADNETPLMLAITAKQRDLVSELVKEGHADIYQKDEAGRTLLCTAIQLQCTEVVKYLFEQSFFELGSSNTPDELLKQLIAEQPNRELLITLLTSKMSSDFTKDTLFNLAMLQEDSEIIKLVKSTQDLGDRFDDHGWSLAWLETFKHTDSNSGLRVSVLKALKMGRVGYIGHFTFNWQ
ncbi:Serine/threonine-protein phosphatase 6 regulatory ankyrin repeat subunit A [Trichoderma ghanense]|uniref:Serine/threonine-protein phosphatase 6 regulatory ankyrin repeat subunit A n=1 Tax=Trichoderma ghanense TaxID=65468 RepID=A0ABY2GYM9_9HYPO